MKKAFRFSLFSRQRKIASLFLSLFLLFSSSTSYAFAATTYLYDANGNMTSDGQNCYTYNEANELSVVKNCSTNQVIAQYIYDGSGQRIEEKEYTNGVLAKTIYDPTTQYETVKLASNSALQNTTYYMANNQVIAKKNPDGTKNYYSNDHLGSVSVITNQNGNLVEQTSYDPWGNVLAGGAVSKYQYTGQAKDQETGLNYYNARYYNSAIQHFTQPDTVVPDMYNPQTLNRYSYVYNNPMRYTDPSGHSGVGPCLSAGISGLGKYSSIEVCDMVVWNNQNPTNTIQKGLTVSFNGGKSTGLSLGIDGTVAYTNASTINELAGLSKDNGGQAAILGFSKDGKGGESLTLGKPGLEVHSGISDTFVHQFMSLSDELHFLISPGPYIYMTAFTNSFSDNPKKSQQDAANSAQELTSSSSNYINSVTNLGVSEKNIPTTKSSNAFANTSFNVGLSRLIFGTN